jgi:histidinol-phosphate phosphatase family protein
MQAVILAGGKGTRLAERLNGRPKPLIDVNGTPLLQRQIVALRGQGVGSFVVLVNHAADQIAEFLQQNDDFDCRVELIDDGAPKGTAGAVLACLDRLSAEFLVVYGDTLFSIDVGRMVNAHRRSGAAGTLFLHPNDHPHDSDLVELDAHDRIVAFHGYPHPPGSILANQVNAAFYVLKRDALVPWLGLTGVVDFGKDLFPKMVDAGVYLNGYRSFEYIKDLGTPKRLDKVERHMRQGVVEQANLAVKQACVFLDRDGTLNVQNGYIRSPDDLVLIPGAGEAVRKLNELNYRLAVVTNQPVIARGEITLDELARIHAKMEADLGLAGAFVDRLYFCPHHPDRGYAGERPELKIDCDCRKPMTGLFEQAVKDLNVDLNRSWMIGDSTADILVARRVGLRSILVGTGEGGRDGKYQAAPDFTTQDLASAVCLIADIYPGLVERVAPILSKIETGSLVLVGGLARSGKSTFASVIAHELRKSGVAATSISLDRWLLPEGSRGSGVEGRFDLSGAAADLATWFAGGPLQAAPPFYDRYRRETSAPGPAVELPKDGVLILEGVPALMGRWPTMRCIIRIFVDSAEAARADRMVSDLNARSLEVGDAALPIYESRSRDESPQVLRSAESADYRVDLDDVFQVHGAAVR